MNSPNNHRATKTILFYTSLGLGASLLFALMKGHPYYMKHSYLQLSLLGCGIGVGSVWASRGAEQYEQKMTSFVSGLLRCPV